MVWKTITTFLLLCSCTLAQNFRGEPRLLEQAEKIRTEQFGYWGYKPLNWSEKCFITFNQDTLPTGRTEFQLEGRQVFGWKMFVSSVDTDTVLRHEIDHTVRASIICARIPRWLDEGTSQLMENMPKKYWEEYLVHSNAAAKWITEDQLDGINYPQDKQKVWELYAFGTGATQVLMERGTPATLISFQTDPRSVSEKLPDYYGMTGAEFIQTWKEYVSAGCPPRIQWRPYPYALGFPKVDGRPLLEIWHAEWCGPCKVFEKDLKDDVAFRNAIYANFHVHFRISDAPFAKMETQLKGIDKVPTFLVPSKGIRTVGYSSDSPDRKTDLLKRLGIEMAQTPYVRPKAADQPPIIIPPLPAEAPVKDMPVKAPESLVSPSKSQDDSEVVPTPLKPSTGQPEASTRPLEKEQKGIFSMGASFVRRNWMGLAGVALIASGFGGGLGVTMLTRWGQAKVGSIATQVATSIIEKKMHGHSEGETNNPPTFSPPVCVSVPTLPTTPPPIPPPEPTPAEDLPKTQIVNVIDELWLNAIIYAHREMLQKYGSNVKEVSCTLKEFISHVRQRAGKQINLNQ